MLRSPHEFDLILMDIQMPEMDGFQATAAIREIEKKGTRRTPIVAMTAHAMKGDRERCLEAGMDGYVSKPVQSKLLYETIEAMTRPADPAESLSHPPVPAWHDASCARCGQSRRDSGPTRGQRWLAPEHRRSLRGRLPGADGFEFRLRSRRTMPARLLSAAHTLKGSLLALSADRASAAALELEKMGRESRLHGAAEWFAILESEVAAVGSELQKIVKERFAVGSRS